MSLQSSVFRSAALMAFLVTACNPNEEMRSADTPVNEDYLTHSTDDSKRHTGCFRLTYTAAPLPSVDSSLRIHPGIAAYPTERLNLTGDKSGSTSWRIPKWPTYAVVADSPRISFVPQNQQPYWYAGRGDSVWVERTFQFDRMHFILDMTAHPIIGSGHFHPDPPQLGVEEFRVQAERIDCG